MGAVYSQLSITERRKIERWRHAKMPVSKIADEIGRHRSTVYKSINAMVSMVFLKIN